MAKGVVKGKNVHNSVSGREHRIQVGGKYDPRKLNGRLVEYRLVSVPGGPSGQPRSGSNRVAKILSVGRKSAQTSRR